MCWNWQQFSNLIIPLKKKKKKSLDAQNKQHNKADSVAVVSPIAPLIVIDRWESADIDKHWLLLIIFLKAFPFISIKACLQAFYSLLR